MTDSSPEAFSTKLAAIAQSQQANAVQAREMVELTLGELKALSAETRKTGTQILQRLTEALATAQLNLPVSRNTILQYMSVWHDDVVSPIVSTGRGYYLSSKVKAELGLQPDADSIPPSDPSTAPQRTQREATLYPLFKAWLDSQGFLAKDTSKRRSNDRWGNPDVTGIKVTDHLQSQEVEIATIEVKADLSAWQYWFFEAVAHRRFANRCYYAFPVKAKLFDELLQGQRFGYYSECFGVGVLVALLDDAQADQLEKGKTALDPEEIEVRELYPAPWSRVPLQEGKDFCDKLGIYDTRSLMDWHSETD